MSQPELLSYVVQQLSDLGIKYMITGSYASSLLGEPRSTNDIDLVISLATDDLVRFVAAFPHDRYYLDPEAVLDSVRHEREFNLIDMRGYGKVDFWPLTSARFDRSRFARRQLRTVFGVSAYFSSPEDTILAKLLWAKKCGGSEKQFRDALRVYETQYPTLDKAYMAEWIDELGVREYWTKLESDAEV